MIDLSKAAVLFWTNPMFTALFAYYFLGEKITPFDWAAITLMIIGIVVIENPFANNTELKE